MTNVAGDARLVLHEPSTSLAGGAEDASGVGMSTRTAKVVSAGADVLTVAAAMATALWLRGVLRGTEPSSTGKHLLFGALSLPVWVLLFSRYRLYSARTTATRLDEMARVVHAVAASVAAMGVASYALKANLARAWLVLTVLLAVPAVIVEREGVRRMFNQLRRSGRLRRPVVIVGVNGDVDALCQMLGSSPSLGYEVVAVVDANDAAAGSRGLAEVRTRERHTGVAATVRKTGASGVIIATPSLPPDVTNRLARELLDARIHVELWFGLRDIAANRLTVHPIGSFPVAYLEPVRQHGWRAGAKRTFDIAVAALLLILSSPVLFIAAVAIRLESRGPVLFRQTRVGRDGQPFRVVKFRTMVVDAEALLVDLRDRNEADGPLFKIRDDPRVTRVGRVLRRFSIDELPQFLNVLRGQMSIVGPRPALPSELMEWTDDAHKRLRVKPGITGMWQVHGRSDSSFADYLRLDLYYVDNWSLVTDLAIVAKTVPTVLFSRGAY